MQVVLIVGFRYFNTKFFVLQGKEIVGWRIVSGFFMFQYGVRDVIFNTNYIFLFNCKVIKTYSYYVFRSEGEVDDGIILMFIKDE